MVFLSSYFIRCFSTNIFCFVISLHNILQFNWLLFGLFFMCLEFNIIFVFCFFFWWKKSHQIMETDIKYNKWWQKIQFFVVQLILLCCSFFYSCNEIFMGQSVSLFPTAFIKVYCYLNSQCTNRDVQRKN